MTATSIAPSASGTAAAVLADAVRLRAVADDAERQLLVRAVQWAHAHLEGPAGVVTSFDAGDDSCGLPVVAWDAGVEFALAVGMSPVAGERMITEALELCHRLGRTWGRVLTGDLPAWRARRVAATTVGHPADVAAWVDERVAAVAHKVGAIKLEKLLDEAMLRLHPEQREQEQLAGLDARQVRMLADISANGVARIVVDADLKDCVDFHDRVVEIARLLAAAGSQESLEVRKALAVGILADPGRALALLEEGSVPRRLRKKLSLVVHLSEDAITRPGCTCPDASGGVGRLERGDEPVLASMVRQWCGRDDTHVSVTPVIDTGDHIGVDRYEIPDRLVAQVDQALGCCVFPWCTRPARACDHDHITPHSQGGATCSCNLAPLCRRHHRLKTHTAWAYDPLGAGAYLWHSPAGRCYYRDPEGTVDVTLPGDADPGHDGCTQPGLGWHPGWLRERRRHLTQRLKIVDQRRGLGDMPTHPPDDFLDGPGNPLWEPDPWHSDWDHAQGTDPPWSLPDRAPHDIDTPAF